VLKLKQNLIKDKPIFMDQNFNQFFEDLLIKANLTSLKDDYKAAYKEKLFQQLLERLGLVALEKLPEEKIKEYEKLVKQESSQKILTSFFEKNIPDYKKLVEDVVLQFGQEFLEITSRGSQASV
jgi:hypothetical protein